MINEKMTTMLYKPLQHVLIVEKNNVAQNDLLNNRWLTTFPNPNPPTEEGLNVVIGGDYRIPGSREGWPRNFHKYSERQVNEYLKYIMTGERNIPDVGKVNQWVSNSYKKYKPLKTNFWIKEYRNKFSNHEFKLDTRNIQYDFTLNLSEYSPVFDVSGYGYSINTQNLTNKFPNLDKSAFFIKLTGIAHAYSRRSRRDVIFQLPNVSNKDFYFHVAKDDYARLTWYTDYGGWNEAFTIQGNNNRVILILEGTFDCWSNRINSDAIFRSQGSVELGNQVIVLNSKNLRMSPGGFNAIKLIDDDLFKYCASDEGDVNYDRLVNKDKIKVTVVERFDYSLPWTS